MRHFVGTSSNGVDVFVDLITSSAAKHIARQPQLLGLIEEVLQKTSLRSASIATEQDMGRTIGYNFVVSTTPKDSIFYAQLIGEKLYTRFVRSSEAHPTRYLTIVLHRQTPGGDYELDDAWIGRLAPPRPGATDETTESRPFWSAHAVIPGDQPLQARTITKVCPY